MTGLGNKRKLGELLDNCLAGHGLRSSADFAITVLDVGLPDLIKSRPVSRGFDSGSWRLRLPGNLYL